MISTVLLLFSDNLTTLFNGLHIQRNKTMMTFRQRFEKSFLYASSTYNRGNLEQSTQHNHVEHLTVFHLGSLVHRINTIYCDVATCRRINDSETVVYQNATRFEFWFKLFQRRLVEHNGNVKLTEDW